MNYASLNFQNKVLQTQIISIIPFWGFLGKESRSPDLLDRTMKMICLLTFRLLDFRVKRFSQNKRDLNVPFTDVNIRMTALWPHSHVTRSEFLKQWLSTLLKDTKVGSQ